MLIFFLISLAAAAGLYWDIHLTGKPPVTLPIDVSGGVSRSPPFTVYARGLYLVLLDFNGSAAKAKLDCVHDTRSSPLPPPFDCAPNAPPPSWSIYRQGKMVARDDLGPPAAVDGIVRSFAGRFDREIGAVELPAGSGYMLEVRPQAAADSVGFVQPTVSIRLHPWDVEKGWGKVVAFWFAAICVATGLLSMLVIVAASRLARFRADPAPN
ncbi:MAG TPA: hypothetical protein VFE18_08625 [Phenylobacterium sp.]|uniref:hypothetical protein n=1 Tax=Phenylobacterium sp. TaxID=1871053 RepID=UPI002D25C084|nr:hypothetical protein [Phenylobacterium sp.]HZZ68225.1 hypothetical protein [Phenylobacterium sp.]